jgi:hypothetical protein
LCWTTVGGRLDRCRRQRIVCLVFDHRPDHDAERLQGLFERNELREKIRIDPRTRLESRPEPVAKRLDDVIGGDADVGDAAIDHPEDRADDGAHRTDFSAILVAG